MVYVTGWVCQFRRWNGVLPDVRAGRSRWCCWARTSARSRATGSFPLAGHLPQVRVETGMAGGAGCDRGGHIVHE
jgi:hypothetical protein